MERGYHNPNILIGCSSYQASNKHIKEAANTVEHGGFYFKRICNPILIHYFVFRFRLSHSLAPKAILELYFCVIRFQSSLITFRLTLLPFPFHS